MFKIIYPKLLCSSFFILLFIITFNSVSNSSDIIFDEKKSSESDTNDGNQVQQDLDFYIINLFGNAVTLECEDIIFNKSSSLTINNNGYSKL